jgi:hypothetical protein
VTLWTSQAQHVSSSISTDCHQQSHVEWKVSASMSYAPNQIKETEVGRTCGMHGRGEESVQGLAKPEGMRLLGNWVVDGRMGLQWISGRQAEGVLRIVTGGRLWWMWWWTSRFWHHGVSYELCIQCLRHLLKLVLCIMMMCVLLTYHWWLPASSFLSQRVV